MNKDVYIVCGGTSLKGFDFEKLKDKVVIAVNYACFNIPYFDYVSAIDFDFYEDNKEKIKLIDKPFYAIENYHDSGIFKELNVNTLTHSGEKGYDERKGYCKHGFNSGYFAVQLALDLGYKNIHILGMDAHYTNNQYFFKQGTDDDLGYNHLPEYMKALKSQLPKGINIYNYSDISTIKCFPFKKLSDI